MHQIGKKFTDFCISFTNMRRGSADITVDKESKSSKETFFKGNKSFASVFKGKAKKMKGDGLQSQDREEEEALRCLDEIIELENRQGSLVTKGHILGPIKSPTPNTGKASQTVKNGETKPRLQKTEHCQEIKYGTIKGFDSFMLY